MEDIYILHLIWSLFNECKNKGKSLFCLLTSYEACCCKLAGQGQAESQARSDKNVHNSRLCSEFSKITQIMQEIIMELKHRGDS